MEPTEVEATTMESVNLGDESTSSHQTRAVEGFGAQDQQGYIAGEEDRGSGPIDLRLGKISKATLGVVPILLVVVIVLMPGFGASIPFYLIPTLGMGFWWWPWRRKVRIDDLISAYGIGLFPGAIFIWILQSIYLVLVVGLTAVGTASEGGNAMDDEVLATIIIVCGIGFCVVWIEEMIKLRMMERRSKDDMKAGNTRSHLFVSTAGCLGYATAQAALFSFFYLKFKQTGDAEFGEIFIIGLLMSLYNMPMHCLCGYLIGLGVAKRHVLNRIVDTHQIIWVPIIFRTIFLGQFVIVLMLLDFQSAIRVVTAFIIGLLLMVCLVFYIKYQERFFPAEYLERAGQLSIGGYGALLDYNPHSEVDDTYIKKPTGGPDHL